MCGIAGWFGPAGSAARGEVVDGILAEQAARGPDHRGVHGLTGRGAQVILGHNRLSIIDLSAAGHQPMARPDAGQWVTYNGEIYNYLELREELIGLGDRFATRSDTEVLLAAWARFGPDAATRFNGMFAFGIFDTGTDELHLVRDRFGVKPICYAIRGDELVFASTPGAVARQLGRGPDLRYAARGEVVGIYDDDSDRSPYEGVRSVPAGHSLRVRLRDGRVTTDLRCWYDLAARVVPLRDELAGVSAAGLVTRTADLLESAVTLRLRSDVPVGLSLSGGVDSSSLASLAGVHGNLVGFTYGEATEARSEGPLVAEVAARAGIPVEFIPSARAQTLTEVFDATLAAQDAPFLGYSILAQFAVCRAARAAGVKVLLGGQGGDEVFMGYHKFRIFRARELAARGHLAGAFQMAWGGVRAIGASRFTFRALRRNLARYGAAPRSAGALRGFADAASIPELGYRSSEPLWRRQARDVTALSLPTLLRYEDRNSMANSIETRLPFMDYRLVEFGLALPEALKIRHGQGKWILREAMADRLPAAIRWGRGKRNFDANPAHAVAAGLGALLRARLHEVAGSLRTLLGGLPRIDAEFTDEALSEDQGVFTEAVALIWLGQRLGNLRSGADRRLAS